MFMTMDALLSVMLLMQVLELISQMSSYAFVSVVPAHKSFLSLLSVMHEISGEEESGD
jgi:hypothetical protein